MYKRQELNVGNAKVKKTTANESITKANAMYSIAGATFGIFSDQNCSNQIGTLTTNENGDTKMCIRDRSVCRWDLTVLFLHFQQVF